MSVQKVNVEGMIKLQTFCHATIAGDFIYVSGTLGTDANNENDLVAGGTQAETEQTLRNIETILQACDASLKDVVKMNVFLADMETFPKMNEAYLSVMGDDPPARITVGKAGLALGAAVEIDAVAYKPA